MSGDSRHPWPAPGFDFMIFTNTPATHLLLLNALIVSLITFKSLLSILIFYNSSMTLEINIILENFVFTRNLNVVKKLNCLVMRRLCFRVLCSLADIFVRMETLFCGRKMLPFIRVYNKARITVLLCTAECTMWLRT